MISKILFFVYCVFFLFCLFCVLYCVGVAKFKSVVNDTELSWGVVTSLDFLQFSYFANLHDVCK